MYRLNPSIRLRAIQADGSRWAFDTAGGSHYELNETAFRVLQGVLEAKSEEEIAAALAAEYNVATPRAEADVEGALAQFERDGLVTKEETS